MSKQLPPLTEFQKTILWAASRGLNEMMDTWEIAQTAFPDTWKKRASRGALIGNIRRAAEKMPDFCHVLPAKDRFDTATICPKRFYQ